MRLGFTNEALSNGALLMEAMTRGMQWVREEVAKQGFTSFIVPSIIFKVGSEHPSFEPSRLEFDDKQNAVLVDIHHLQNATRFNHLQLLTELDPDGGGPLFKGTIVDLYTLGSVHETDHARWSQSNGPDQDRKRRIHPSECSAAEYDAQPHELAAIMAERKAAEELHLSPVTIELLETKIALAKACIKTPKITGQPDETQGWKGWRIWNLLKGK